MQSKRKLNFSQGLALIGDLNNRAQVYKSVPANVLLGGKPVMD